VITLKESTPDFPYRTTLSGFCALPERLPPDPEGARAPLPAAGPYYVATWVRGRRIVLQRNQRYGGRRPHHVDSFVVELNVDPRRIVPRIERGTLDTGDVPAEAHARLGRRYRVNKGQYFARPVGLIYHAVLNSSRTGRFASTRLRRAVNFAVDRAALVRAGARVQGAERFGAHWGTPTDQWLVPGFPGYQRAAIYPLRPNLRRARALAKGFRGRTLRIYVRDDQPFPTWAQIVRSNLRAIGLRAQISSFPPDVALEKVFGTPGEPWDLALVNAYGPDYPDPASALGLFEFPPTPAKYLRMFDRAKRQRGAARYRLYGKLDVALSRDVAPTVPFASLNLRTFISRRVGCKVFRPELDLAAVCLKR
jgi:ABC-type transport system substrate-binding protein